MQEGAAATAMAAAAPPAQVAQAAAAATAAAVAGGVPHREEHHLSFLNSKGEGLVGVLLDTGSTDVVVLAHGYVANLSMCQFPRLASKLAEAGISSFRFDHPCAVYTQSERHGPMLMGNHEDEVADMACAVDFLRSRGKRVVCLLGHRCAVWCSVAVVQSGVQRAHFAVFRLVLTALRPPRLAWPAPPAARAAPTRSCLPRGTTTCPRLST